MLQIYDMGPTALLPLRRKACCGFFRPKNPTPSAGIESANLSTKGQHATPRPLKPMTVLLLYINLGCSDSFSPSNEILCHTFCSDFIMFVGMKQHVVITKLSFMFIVKCCLYSLLTY